VVDEGKPEVGSRDEGKHTERNNLLFVEKMMWMDERVYRFIGRDRRSEHSKSLTT